VLLLCNVIIILHIVIFSFPGNRVPGSKKIIIIIIVMQCTDGDGKRASGSSETTPLHADWPAASLPLPYPQLDQSQAAHLSRYPLLLGTDAFPSAETGVCLSEGEWVVYSNEWFLEFDCSWFYKLFYSVTLCGTSAGLGGCLVLPVSLSICLSVCLHSRRKTT